MSDEAKQMLKKKNAGTRRLPCRLTEEEAARYTTQLIGALGDIADVEKRISAQASYLKELKDELKDEEARRDKVGAILRKGEEERSVEFDEVLDYAQSRVIQIRADTGAVIQVLDMDDQQLKMSFVGDAEVQNPEELEKAVVLYFNRGGKADRMETGSMEPEEEDESEGPPDDDETGDDG